MLKLNDYQRLHTVSVASALFWCIFTAAYMPPLHAADDKSDIREAWEARQKKLNNAVFIAKMTTFLPKGRYNGKRGHDPADGDQPSQDTSLRRRVVFSVSGELRRYEYQGEVYHITEGTIPDDGVLVVQDGGEVRKLSKYEHNQNSLQGIIQRRARQLEEERNYPFFFFCRPLATDLDGFEVVEGKTHGATRDIIELATVDGAISYLIDPQRDYSIVSFSTRNTQRDRVSHRTRLEIEYKIDKEYGWVPKNWVLTWHKNGQLLQRCECVLESYRLNPDLEPSLFTLSFPPGTHVFHVNAPNQHGN